MIGRTNGQMGGGRISESMIAPLHDAIIYNGTSPNTRTWTNQPVGKLIHVVAMQRANSYEHTTIATSGLTRISYSDKEYFSSSAPQFTTILSAWYTISSPTISITITGRANTSIN